MWWLESQTAGIKSLTFAATTPIEPIVLGILRHMLVVVALIMVLVEFLLPPLGLPSGDSFPLEMAPSGSSKTQGVVGATVFFLRLDVHKSD